jgi:hypothetical protein
VVPASKTIVEDFYLLLIRINPSNQTVFDLQKGLMEANPKWNKFSKTCQEFSISCRNQLWEIKELFYKNGRIISKLEENFKIYSQDRKSTDNRILLSKSISAISDESHKLLRSLDFFKYGPSQYREISDHVKNIELSSNLLTTGFLEDEIQDSFFLIYSNFFKMLDDIVRSRNLGLFNREVENLNITWNNFNMKVPKLKDSLSPESMGIIASIHRKWNGILRVIWTN